MRNNMKHQKAHFDRENVTHKVIYLTRYMAFRWTEGCVIKNKNIALVGIALNNKVQVSYKSLIKVFPSNAEYPPSY